MTGMAVKVEVSLDNLTIVGTPKFTTSEIRSMLISKGHIISFWQTPYKRYNDNYTILGGGMLQITHEKGFVDSNKFTVHQIRLEFNPNKVKLYQKLVPEYLEILKWICEPKITRKDIAIDLLDIDINDFIVLDYSGRKRIEYKAGNMRLETLYFGSKFSDIRHRIYDKALEQGLNTTRVNKDGETIREGQNINWWRVEAQIRKEKAEMRRYNPFQKIKIVSKQDFFQYEVRTRAMLFYLQANPDAMKELSVNVRSKYKKLLGESIDYWFIDLQEICEIELENIQSEIESWLNFSPLDVSEGFRVTALKTCLELEEETQTEEEKQEMLDFMKESWEGLPDEIFKGGKESWEEWLKERDKRE